MGKLDITFLGGIESKKYNTSIGGSCQLYTYTLRTQIANILLDRGIFVGMSKKPDQSIDPEILDAVIITHVHNDHIGMLVELVKAGYKKSIYMTPLSAKLASPIFDDALKIQRAQISAVKEYNKRLGSKLQGALSAINTPKKKEALKEKTLEGYIKLLDEYNIIKNSDIKNVLKEIPSDPAFDEHDIMQTISQIRPIIYGQEFDLYKGLIKAHFIDAGHVPGSAQVIMQFHQQKHKTKLLYTLLNTGDLGRFHDNFLLESPSVPDMKIDATIVEGTYGGRQHTDRAKEIDQLTRSINIAQDIFVLPAFSLQRFQEIMYALRSSVKIGKIHLKKGEKIYCTSPLAYEFSKILMAEDPEKYKFLSDSLFYRIQSREDEKAYASIKGRKIIIAGGGMVQGGSSVKHVQKALQNPKANIWLTGYQAEGTLGKELLDKYQTDGQIQIGEKKSPIRATVKQLRSFSSHADESELVAHMAAVGKKQGHRTIITHGGEQRLDLKQAMQDTDMKTSYTIPDMYDTITTETNKKERKMKD